MGAGTTEGSAVVRRLAAILAADVVNYSRLMHADEAGTLAALKARRREVLDPLVARHGGRLFKLIGDGALIEFGSAVNAVQCAVAVQEAFAAVNAEIAEDRRIVLRIGVHLGDVMVEGSDLYGDGVNIAARLEGLSEPGGVLVSEDVHRQISNKVSLAFDDIGQQNLKNISQPVRAYRLVQAHGAPTEMKRATSDKISIAVLPFDNMSGDPEQAYFSDGITEDIITELSRFRELRVIARNSSFQFRGDKNNVREVGRKLDAKFVIEGSVRRAANRIRITVQLIEAASQVHIWSERYDRDMVDVFEVQEEIARTIAVRVAGHARASAVDRLKNRPTTESFSAYDLLMRARQLTWSYGEQNGEHDLEQATLLFKALELDPRLAAAYGMLADDFSVQFLRTGDQLLIEKSLAFGRQGIAVDREDPWANYGLGLALIYGGSLSDAGFYLQRAVELNPNDVSFLGIYAIWLCYVGRGEEALTAIREAIKRDPHGQEWFWDVQGAVFTVQGMYQEAVDSFTKMTELPCWSRCFRAFSLMKSGDPAQARTLLQGFERPAPDLIPSVLMDRILPDIVGDFRKDLLDTLRNLEAGLFDGASPKPEGG